MLQYILTAIFLLIPLQTLAGDNKIYTNEDLIEYGSKSDPSLDEAFSYHEDQAFSAPDIKDEIIQEQKQIIGNQEKMINILQERLEGPSRILPGKDCEIVEYETWTSSYAVHNPEFHAVIDGVAYATVITKQEARVSVKSKYQMHRWVKDIHIIAVFQNGHEQEGILQPEQGDSSTTQISPHQIYTGHVSFKSEHPIVSLGCIMNPGL